MHLQQLVHLLQLELVVGDDVEHAFLTLDFAFAALEVEPRPDLAGNSRKGVVNFGKLDPRNDVEARHSRLLRFKKRFPSGIARITRRETKISADREVPVRA